MKSHWFLALNNSALKVVSIVKNYSNVGVVLGVNNEVAAKYEWRKDALLITPVFIYMVLHILYSILFPWFTKSIFQLVLVVCVNMLVGWLIFMYKVTSKIRFDVLLGRGVGFMKNVAVTFFVPKLIYEWPQTNLCIIWWKVDKFEALFCRNQRLDKNKNWIDCFFRRK